MDIWQIVIVALGGLSIVAISIALYFVVRNRRTRSMTPLSKRSSGWLTRDGKWQVLVESTSVGKEYKHSCGAFVMSQEVTLSERDGVAPFSGGGEVERITVPFCPQCEREPTGGTFGPRKGEVYVHS